jgi:tetratricopeptide (TPR) repeat protein
MTLRSPAATLRLAASLALLSLAAQAAAQDCPSAPDITGQIDGLIAEIRVAPNEAMARPISARMWELWTRAPDASAQEMLDTGIALIRMADYPGATALLDDLVAYCPDYAEGYNQRAFASFLGGDYGAALDDLDRALALSPNHVAALSGKALTLLGLGRTPEGQAVLRDALRLNPWLGERALLLGPPGEEL